MYEDMDHLAARGDADSAEIMLKLNVSMFYSMIFLDVDSKNILKRVKKI